MEKQEVIDQIKKAMKEILDIDINDNHDNLVNSNYSMPVSHLLYVFERLEHIYGEEIYEILAVDDYQILEVSNFADAIMNVCNKKEQVR